MSMLDGLFNKGFKAAKCKTLLKLTIPRIKLLRNRREIQIKQMRKDIAKLLETDQEATARIRVEHIIREENMMAAQEIIELFCELISVRLPIIEAQRECPLDLKEAISSVCFAAPRCADLPELLQVQMLFTAKYGKEYVSAATELMPDCGVNRQLIELLSIRPPAPDVKLKLLKEIAEEHELGWDPAASETEFFKPHEDLLNGPTQFFSGSKLPLPKEKNDESLPYTPDQAPNEQSDSDAGFDSLEFPEVPKVSLQPSADAGSASEINRPLAPTTAHPEAHPESANQSEPNETLAPELTLEPEEVVQSDISVSAVDNKQFVPFISPPSLSSTSLSPRQSGPPHSVSRTKSEAHVYIHDVLATAQAAAESADRSVLKTQSKVHADSDDVLLAAAQAAAESAEHTAAAAARSVSRTKSEVHVDLHDVLAAAQAAAESAERAAAAARSAASLAEVRITELTKKNAQATEDLCENPFGADSYNQSVHILKPFVDRQDSLGESDNVVLANAPEFHQDPGSKLDSQMGFSSPLPSDTDHGSSHHQPQRLTSMEEDAYFSYPNLFRSQDSNLGSSVHSFTDNSRSTHEP